MIIINMQHNHTHRHAQQYQVGYTLVHLGGQRYYGRGMLVVVVRHSSASSLAPRPRPRRVRIEDLNNINKLRTISIIISSITSARQSTRHYYLLHSYPAQHHRVGTRVISLPLVSPSSLAPGPGGLG